MDITLKQIATIHTDFDEKFGVPRQSGIVPELEGTITFEPEFRNPDVVRGIEGFSHLWLIWGFSENMRDGWSATVRPPRLGGNERRGVFATRSPFRPNPIGLSVVRLDSVTYEGEAASPVLHVLGADMMDGTPIYDIKPYIAYSDAIAEANSGFAASPPESRLQVVYDHAPAGLAAAKLPALTGVLSQDPRPAYQDDPDRIYGIRFAGCDIHFKVIDNVLHVIE
ncbi:MAG: tRNA (N6-threonylcarbamoyladenosine(37)-N6)-methyltransferase TrmO [Firmicutes bacterium]|nr:tRNA (N6-threonylcarbamoyladenosine(37)-N6)-methyltransferase TrmO [Bacillota bacterium]